MRYTYADYVRDHAEKLAPAVEADNKKETVIENGQMVFEEDLQKKEEKTVTTVAASAPAQKQKSTKSTHQPANKPKAAKVNKLVTEVNIQE